MGTAACPPYHIAFVIGGTSAEKNLLTVKLASTHYYDCLLYTSALLLPVARPDAHSAAGTDIFALKAASENLPTTSFAIDVYKRQI